MALGGNVDAVTQEITLTRSIEIDTADGLAWCDAEEVLKHCHNDVDRQREATQTTNVYCELVAWRLTTVCVRAARSHARGLWDGR